MSGPAPITASLRERLDSTAVVCRDWAEQDLGPYHLDRPPARQDITEDRPGVALHLGLAIAAADRSPLAAAQVEIWHCDAAGVYSGYPPTGFTGQEGPAEPEYEVDRRFLRGVQPTDPEGIVEFHTIYPGWYPGRTVHIHVIARAAGRVFTSQLYFPDALTDAVFSRPAYSERPGRDTTNATDVIFPTGGEPAVLDVGQEPEMLTGVARLHLPVDGSRA